MLSEGVSCEKSNLRGEMTSRLKSNHDVSHGVFTEAVVGNLMLNWSKVYRSYESNTSLQFSQGESRDLGNSYLKQVNDEMIMIKQAFKSTIVTVFPRHSLILQSNQFSSYYRYRYDRHIFSRVGIKKFKCN